MYFHPDAQGNNMNVMFFCVSVTKTTQSAQRPKTNDLLNILPFPW